MKKFPNRKPRDVTNQSHVRPGEEPEEALWRHVIMLAIDDATKPLTETQMKKSTVRLDRQRAREWLLGDSERFRMACQCAGAQIEQVRSHVRKLIEQADAQQRAVLNDIKVTATNALANQQKQTADFLAVTCRGMGQSFQMEAENRGHRSPCDAVQIGISTSNDNSTQDQGLNAATSHEIRIITIVTETKL